MFGFLAALGPVGIAAAVIGTVATAAIASDSGSSSSRSDNREDLTRRAKEDEKSSINRKIELFKSDSIKMIKNKYKENITFTGNEVKISHKNTSNVNVIEKHLNTLKLENSEIENLIRKLMSAKNAV